jgi:AraC-like DNA-binding protein
MTEHSAVYHRTNTVDNYSEIKLAVQRYVEENYEKPVTLADFVNDKGFSKRSVQRALSWHGSSWQRLLLDARMKRARELLAHSGEPINRVAEMVGYDHSNFSRMFKAEEGRTPEEYREWVRNEPPTAA